jgi:hypothetical protein
MPLPVMSASPRPQDPKASNAWTSGWFNNAARRY